MINHEVEVAKISKIMSSSNKDKEMGSKGIIVVKPPITIGEVFENAICGRNRSVNLSHVLSTSEETVFIAGSYLKTTEQRETAIYTLADRIKHLADDPKKVFELLNENPFPKIRR